MPLSYGAYLKIDELLNLQECKSEGPEHDELLFITIHQAYELWFKQIMHELFHMSDLLKEGHLRKAGHTLKRVVTIQKVLVHQFDILETMTPAEFLSFRDYLETASGFQSAQFRALEFTLGYKRPGVMDFFERGSKSRTMLEKCYNDPTIWDVVMAFMKERGYDIPEDMLQRDFKEPVQANKAVQDELLKASETDDDLFDFLEHLTDLDEGIGEWRYRHVKMVERVIGNMKGTGGSSGVEYLKGTLFKPFFPDLWEIRTRIGASQ